MKYSCTSMGCESALSILKHEAHQNSDLSNELLQYLTLLMYSKEPEELHIVLAMIKELLLIDDQLQAGRLSVFGILCDDTFDLRLKDDYLPFSLIIDMFIEAAIRSEAFRKHMKSKLEYMRKWLGNNLFPAPRAMYWYRTSESYLKVIQELAGKKECIAYNKERVNVLKNLLKNDLKQLVPEQHKIIPIGKWTMDSMIKVNWELSVKYPFDIRYL
eukprot:TRINITY_DN5368_c0_g7_i1.p1 TRINITY_DN5368_c0_g7~~TRINITY_DN5368_c0_g7_i1.p1  ORF type:complete len:215 (+),score=37.70 TRINITY_DN5368_c0_g7_i1:168-812(+)